MRILGIDPGKNTGYAVIEVIDKKIKATGLVGTDRDEKVDNIKDLIPDVDVVVMEDFLIRPDKARKGYFDYNNMVAPRVIGKIEMLCELHSVPLEKQQASLKPPAYGFANMKYQKGKKGMHWQDAFAHACYYAVVKLGASPVGGG